PNVIESACWSVGWLEGKLDGAAPLHHARGRRGVMAARRVRAAACYAGQNKFGREDNMAHDQDALTRRRFVQGTAASSLVFAGFARTGRAQGANPNIVFILADDLGYADVSCYGQRDYTTPNLDRLALQGMRFTQSYSNSANCSPTRTGLITGRYQMRLEVGLEEPINASTPKSIGLPPSHPTLPSLLKKAGYGTSLVGKWHLGFLPDFSPIKSGYDKFFGIYSGAADYFNHGPDAAQSGAEAGQLHEGEVPVERHGYMTNLLANRAVETIEAFAKSHG